ncbi:EAL domain-containing protein [Legionella antarctica]|nr:EAL domain-containing protein [Legionella antarctica]
MYKLSLKPSKVIFKRFTIYWILITIILLLIGLYINWQMSLNRSYRDLSKAALKLSNNVDKVFEDLFQDVYTLPVPEKNFSNCKTGLTPHLKHISLNDPKIAGLIIRNSKNLICSTLDDIQGLNLSNSRRRSISGPFDLKVFDQPVYLIQQRMGSYNIIILTLASTIKNVISSSDHSLSRIELYNSYERKTILRVESNQDRSRWVLSNHLGSLSPTTYKTMFAFNKLYSIPGVSVVVFENENTALRYLVYSEILASLIIIMASYLFYLMMKNILAKRYSLLGAMKSAIKNNEFYPEYQPLFDREKGRYTGAEILLRWQDKQNQIIMPDLFIEEAESNGLIVPITLQIIEIAFNQTRNILNSYPYFHLAFNISALHFTDITFFNKFNSLVREYAISPTQIILEITERDLLDKNNNIFFLKMQELRQAGFSLAVDDYGTGHASISYLNNFPFNYLKIDKLFIQAIGTKAITESLNDAIISMAKRLSLAIIAEGVETGEQVNYLSENGVRFFQGWYFSKALSIEKLINLLQGEENESHL